MLVASVLETDCYRCAIVVTAVPLADGHQPFREILQLLRFALSEPYLALREALTNT